MGINGSGVLGADETPIVGHFDTDQIIFLMRAVGIDKMPAVLAVVPQIYEEQDQDRVNAYIEQTLHARGFADEDGVIDPNLADWFTTLGHPDIEINMRVIEGDAMLRLVIARRGNRNVIATRFDSEVVIQPLSSQSRDFDKLIGNSIIAALGPCTEARFESFTAPHEEIDEIATSTKPGDVEHELRNMGASWGAARIINEASRRPKRFAEIVAIEHYLGGSKETPFSVGVLDPDAGRIVASVRIRADDVHMTTFAPGDERNIRRALAELVAALPSGDWFRPNRSVARNTPEDQT